MEACFRLLRKIALWLSYQDLVEEFYMLCIYPLSWDLGETLDSTERVFDQPRLILPNGANRK